MHIGSVLVDLEIPENDSLKGKRSVVKSIVERVRQKFRLHAAEVDQLDMHQAATIGLVLCGNEQAHVNSVLSKAVDWIEHHQFEANVLDVDFQFFQH